VKKAAVVFWLRRLARLWPRGSVIAGHALALVAGRLGYGIADHTIAAAFPEIDRRARRRVRRRTFSSFLKGEAVDAGVQRRRNLRDYPRLVPDPALDRLRPPLIVASFHVGPFQALGAVLRSLEGRPVIVSREQFMGRPDITMLHEGDDEGQRARTLNRALAALRSDGVLLVMLDGLRVGDRAAPTIEVPMLGRALPLARGAFALARMSGTAIVPMVSRWRGSSMAMTVGDPIAPELGEEGMAAAAGAWLERYLRERPEEISVFVLDLLRPPLPR
jgi:lauroyl/myristoyl acyltransferase